jgi:hypothetical protein
MTQLPTRPPPWPLDHCRQGCHTNTPFSLLCLTLIHVRSVSSPEGWPNMAASLGWLEESDPSGVILYVMDGPCPACLFRSLLIALTGAAQMRADEISNCCYIVNVSNHPLCVMSRKDGMAWQSSRPMPSLWLRYQYVLYMYVYISWETGAIQKVLNDL